MAWFYIKLPGGMLKVKPRKHLRTAEIKREVPTLNLGFVVFAWWNHKNIARDSRRRYLPY